ncbi:hypothetical protein D3C81_1848710 [compost metagenome]
MRYIDHKITSKCFDAAQFLNHDVEVVCHLINFSNPMRFIDINIEISLRYFLGSVAEISNGGQYFFTYHNRNDGTNDHAKQHN